MTKTLWLHLGTHATGLAVEPVPEYAGMYRVRYADGVLSPMANRTRCKAEAVTWARRTMAANRHSAPVWLAEQVPAKPADPAAQRRGDHWAWVPGHIARTPG